MNDAGLEYDLQYDRLHNLTSFNNHGGAALAQFSYDGDGMRVVKTSAERTVVYHYDTGGRVISETDNNGNLISDFAYANGKLVAKVEPGARYFYHTDPAGTPLAMTDVGGSVVWRADYLPFGEENLISGTLENDFRFVGKENDKETGLYYFGARYMEAMIGRFISTDPVGAVDPRTGRIKQMIIHDPQRINSYAYGLNNPYKYIDPDGEFAIALAIPVIVAYGPAIVTGVEAAVITAVTYVAAKAAVEVYNASKSENKEESKTEQKVQGASGQTAFGQPTDEYGNKLGPSGKPTVHRKRHSTEKEAKDAARQEGDRPPVKHPSPEKGRRHYQATDELGKKKPGSTHHEY